MKLIQYFIKCKTTFLLVLSLLLIKNSFAITHLQESELKSFPTDSIKLKLDKNAQLNYFAISPRGPEVAIIQNDISNKQTVAIWNIESNKLISIISPEEFKLTSLIWHPTEETLFFLAQNNKQQYFILRADKTTNWQLKELLKSKLPLQRLVVGPRPFEMTQENNNQQQEASTSHLQYRLFFGVKKGAHYSIDSINEHGKQRYQVIGTVKENRQGTWWENVNNDSNIWPSEITPQKSDTLPVGFHPAGNIFVVENDAGCYSYLTYWKNWQATTNSFYTPQLCKGSLTFLPNGLGVIQWQRQQNGATIILDQGKTRQAILHDKMLSSAPLVTPNGKAIVAHVRDEKVDALQYIPLSLPLGDITNAWMFVESPQDRELIAKYSGLFRPLANDQLYQLYESELYYCKGYDQSQPTRPYIVTTDIFWETFAAAYEGVFVLFEREIAIPAFWSFIEKAKNSSNDKLWHQILAVAQALQRGSSDDKTIQQELNLIKAAAGKSSSHIIPNEIFDFSNLKSRGHYTASPELENYFRALRYLTQASEIVGTEPLKKLSPDVKNAAMKWIEVYLPFIAPPRAPLVWNPTTPMASYVRDTKKESTVFPLSWGFDNEALYGTVFHQDWPQEEQITSTKGPRLLPNPLDLPTIFGSDFAETLLNATGAFKQYPNLQIAISKLKEKYQVQKNPTNNLYDQWLAALAVQWSNSVELPTESNESSGRELFLTKRIQTGLASWTTLRHATVLVNERSAAECGEGGFEPIILEFPRGYVESDPATFEAIAGLFEQLKNLVASVKTQTLTAKPNEKQVDYAELEMDPSLQAGVLRRLQESADKARYFAKIAQKQLQNKPLTSQEYEDIFYVGRTAEHNFLVFKSLARPDLALSNPDPMAKIADVAGNTNISILMTAVGRPLEWDFAYPTLGTRRLAKGAVYSFYELVRSTPLNDTEWRKILDKQNRPQWIQPFMSNTELSCPVKLPF